MDASVFQYEACLLSGLAAMLAACGLLHGISIYMAMKNEVKSFYEHDRIHAIAKENVLYRVFCVAIIRLSGFAKRVASPQFMRDLQLDLRLTRRGVPWKAEEYVVYSVIVSVLLSVVVLVYVVVLSRLVVAALATFMISSLLISYVITNGVRNQARRIRLGIVHKLPYTINLIALMMDSGNGLSQSITAIVNENIDHPLEMELGLVLREMDLGKSQNDAFESFYSRLPEQEIRDLVFAIISSDKLGTNLAETLRIQSKQMFMRRSQMLEKESAEAQVAIVFPGLLIMIACILVIVAPFVLQAFYGVSSHDLFN